MRLNTVLLIRVLAGLAASYASSVGASAAEVPQPATWMPHDLEVRLESLPRRYSCDDLWYKFRDVLLMIGARSDLQILAYGCESALGEAARSPRVHLRFQLPQALHGKDLRWADLRAVETTVKIEPGRPSSLNAADCELLRQMKDTLLAELPDHIVSFRLPCRAPVVTQPAFSLSIEALTPAVQSPPRVAGVGPARATISH